jgi:hypothetical protein
MNIVLPNGATLRGDMVLNITQRLDMTPMPSTVEATVRVDSQSASYLEDGGLFALREGGASYRIVKSTANQNLTGIQGNRLYSTRTIIAFLDECKEATYLPHRAVILSNTSFGAVYRALGCKINIQSDLKLAHFAGLSGSNPSTQIAKQLWEEGAVMYWNGKGLVFARCADVLKQEPVLTIREDYCEAVESGLLLRHSVPAAYSPTVSGEIGKGAKAKSPTGKQYMARVTPMQMGQMQDFLVKRRIFTGEYTPHLKAGDVVVVGQTRHVIVTVAHSHVSGSDSGGLRGGTRCWLYTLNR